MRDMPVIVIGLVIVLVILTVPFWYALASGQADAPPEVQLPAGQTQCVEDLAYMKAHHMDLLDEWRDAVVRKGEKTYVSKAYGDHYEMSLTKTCLKCHESRQTFCYQCHSYANVHPYCWDCHLETNE